MKNQAAREVRGHSEAGIHTSSCLEKHPDVALNIETTGLLLPQAFLNCLGWATHEPLGSHRLPFTFMKIAVHLERQGEQ